MAQIEQMFPSDYDEVIALWKNSKGISVDESDSRDGIRSFLSRNPSMSCVAREGGILVGAVLGGHDGRRGYLHHLAVAQSHRGRGIGRLLAENVLAALAVKGIIKCHLFVRTDNAEARRFWSHAGWRQRDDIVMMTQLLHSASA